MFIPIANSFLRTKNAAKITFYYDDVKFTINYKRVNEIFYEGSIKIIHPIHGDSIEFIRFKKDDFIKIVKSLLKDFPPENYYETEQSIFI